jgi:ubiquitin-protein ligase
LIEFPKTYPFSAPLITLRHPQCDVDATYLESDGAFLKKKMKHHWTAFTTMDGMLLILLLLWMCEIILLLLLADFIRDYLIQHLEKLTVKS